MAGIILSSSSASHWKARAVFIPPMALQTWHEWCHLRECCGCGSSLSYFSPSLPSSSRRRHPHREVAGGDGVPLHWHMAHEALSVRTKNDLFTSSFWRKEKISGDILLLFHVQLFLDGAAASHVKRFVSFEFSLNCIISVSAPWRIMAVLFAESLIISSGLLS